MIKLPDNIEKEMQFYRKNLVSVPRSFIEFHRDLATIDSTNQDWVILENHGLVSDGWWDGNKVVELVVAFKENDEWKIETVRWDNSGSWFKKGAGWTRFREMIVE